MENTGDQTYTANPQYHHHNLTLPLSRSAGRSDTTSSISGLWRMGIVCQLAAEFGKCTCNLVIELHHVVNGGGGQFPVNKTHFHEPFYFELHRVHSRGLVETRP